MLSKGQGKTMGSYMTLLNALAEGGRLEEAEELWKKLFSENLECMPHFFFDKMISIYYRREMHDKMFEVFADMEELGIRPTVSIISMLGDVFQKLDMLDKYEKLKKKYTPKKKEYRYVKGERMRIRSKPSAEYSYTVNGLAKLGDETNNSSFEPFESTDVNTEVSLDKLHDSKNEDDTCSANPVELINPSLIT